MDGPAPLPGTEPLTDEGDLALRMVAGISAHLDGLLASAADAPVEALAAEEQAARRRRLAHIVGAADDRLPFSDLQLVATLGAPSLRVRTERYEVHAVRWPVLEGVEGEGLLLQPAAPPTARVVVLPDADSTPEEGLGLALCARLAEMGCEIVVPCLTDRADTWSGNPSQRMTNQPHREFVYRMAFEMGRHIIGYEVQKVRALVDLWSRSEVPVGLFGYGEGGLIALHTAALDDRIAAAAVSGHFRHRRRVWEEPIYRNVWGLLPHFGDAGLAALVAPRGLVIEAAPGPTVDGPPPPRAGRTGAAPGRLAPAPLEEIRAEVERAAAAYAGAPHALTLIAPGPEDPGPGCQNALGAFARLLGVPAAAMPTPSDARPLPALAHPDARQRRQFDQLCAHTQTLLRRSGDMRQRFWSNADPSSVQAWTRTTSPYRQHLRDEVIGRLPPPSLPPEPRTRCIYDRPGWTGHEVVLDLWPGVFASGILLLPKDLAPGERRPAVVCQHGLEGRARDTVEGPVDSPYRAFAAQLADRGYVVYAPQNPYIGGDAFRVLQRKANPLGLSLFSFIVAQHAATLRWLGGLPWVDPARIAFYGLSYGGKTAMRVPALLDGYCLSICSADFNEWIVKNVSLDLPMSYMFMGEYEMPEFDLGHTFNYAEMADLIAPRPFMVERGHRDGVGLDEWVAFEYAKVRRRYADLGIADRTEIAFFAGGHWIDGTRTFPFLERFLGDPRRERPVRSPDRPQ